MRLGTRWAVGAPLPAAVPAELLPSIRAAEENWGLRGSWTLTWLESRPIATAEDGTVVRITASGQTITVLPGADDEDDDEDLFPA